MSSIRDDLEFAYKLIKRDKTQDALDLLRPIVTVEPRNIHAWWLLAYAATEPREVREALLQVLRLDPNYPNAPKAREMLLQLNREYPPERDELERFPELATTYGVPSDTMPVEVGGVEVAPEAPPEAPTPPPPTPVAPAAEDLTDYATDYAAVPPPEFAPEELPPFEAAEDADDLFESVLFEDSEAESYPEEDPFATLDQDLRAAEADQAADEALASLTFDDDIFAEPLPADLEPEFPDEELVVAQTQERPARRGASWLLLGLLVIVIALAGALAVYFIMSQDDGTGDDPGALIALSLDNEQIASARSAVDAQLPSIGLAERGRGVVAPSSIGNTFYVELCSAPSPALPRLVDEGMALAAAQASALSDDISAVGVTVDRCLTDRHDVLYRSVVAREHAQRYINGEITWDEFRTYWLST